MNLNRDTIAHEFTFGFCAPRWSVLSRTTAPSVIMREDDDARLMKSERSVESTYLHIKDIQDRILIP